MHTLQLSIWVLALLVGVGLVFDFEDGDMPDLEAARHAEDSERRCSEEPCDVRGDHEPAPVEPIARDTADPALECEALNGLGTLDQALGRLDDARRRYEAALAVARASADRRWDGGVLGNLGYLDAAQGRMPEALYVAEWLQTRMGRRKLLT